MRFHVLTLFPEMIEQGVGTSILGRAMKQGCISLEAVNIRDYTENKHKKVDDYPYGGGAGMLMQAQPVFDCYQAVLNRIGNHKKTRVIYLTPQGRPFHQRMAEELSEEQDLIFLCGHYEGIDERVLEEIVTDYVSIGDYVLTGGEMPAMIMIDAIARLVPGVLHNETSADYETFHNDLLEYPQYSRPEEWHGKRVPEVLLSGNHAKIEEWRLEQSRQRTEKWRPDLFESYSRKQEAAKRLIKKNKALYIDMAESLSRGHGALVYNAEDGIAVKDEGAKIYLLAVFQEKAAEEVVQAVWQDSERKEEPGWQFVLHQSCLLEPFKKYWTAEREYSFYQGVYTNKASLPVSREIEVKTLTVSFLDEVMSHATFASGQEYIWERLNSGNIFGAFIGEILVGFAEIRREGSLGMPEVYEAYHGKGVEKALEIFLINYQLSCGYMPYVGVIADNEVSLSLQEQLGLKLSKEQLYWLTTGEKEEKGK